MKINLKNRFSCWILLHSNLAAAIAGLTTLLITVQWSSKWLMVLLWSGLIYSISGFILDYWKGKYLYYLKKNEAFYLWLKKTKTGTELGKYFWREKNARYYKIFFGNLPSVKIIKLVNKAVVFGLDGENRIEYITCWATFICKLKGPYSANDLYEKIIKAENIMEQYYQESWKIDGVYYLRKYIISKINHLLIENPRLLTQLEKYKNNQDNQKLIKALKQFLSEINPSEVLENCAKISLLKIEPKIDKTPVLLLSLKRVDELQQKK